MRSGCGSNQQSPREKETVSLYNREKTHCPNQSRMELELNRGFLICKCSHVYIRGSSLRLISRPYLKRSNGRNPTVCCSTCVRWFRGENPRKKKFSSSFRRHLFFVVFFRRENGKANWKTKCWWWKPAERFSWYFSFLFFFLFLCCCCESDESPQPISHANRSLINLTTFPRQLLSLDAIGRTPSASLRLFRPFFLFSFFEGGTISPFSCRFIFSSRSTPSCFPYFDKTALEIVSCGTQLDTAGYCFYRQSSRLVAMLTAEVARASVFCGDPWNEIEKLFAVELPADVLVYFFPPRALALDDGHKRWAISGRLWWRRRVWLCLQCKGMKETEVGLSLSLSVAARWLVER